jgi:hypothetical protein
MLAGKDWKDFQSCFDIISHGIKSSGVRPARTSVAYKNVKKNKYPADFVAILVITSLCAGYSALEKFVYMIQNFLFFHP